MRIELRSWTIVGFTAVIWAALILTGFVTGNTEAFSTISEAVPLLLLALFFFERWGWRYGRLPQAVGVPLVRGTWKGTLQPLAPDQAPGESSGSKVAYLAVEQTLTTVSVRLMTDESESDQIAGIVATRASGAPAISYTYLNTPTIDRREASPIHHGGGLLTIYDGTRLRLEGEYWTERRTKGKLAFTEHAAKVARSYADATALFAAGQPAE
jgi:SMODS-associating 2TM, beta-strand rich effector domain